VLVSGTALLVLLGDFLGSMDSVNFALGFPSAHHHVSD
jgi:hypothetical protein